MVCLGNICRSPLAHGVLEHMANEQGLDWEVDSAGTGNWHVGEGPDRRSVRTAREHGVDISIFVMDKNNLNDVLAQARNKADEQKVKLLLSDKIVPDPYYDDKQFEPVYTMIEAGCRSIIKQLA